MGLRVLVATEIAAERALVRETLARRGDVDRVVEVESGVDAHIVLRNEPIDLAIVSSSLPKIDGVVLVRTIGRGPATRGVRTLLVLGLDAAERMREVIASRPGALLVRPFDAPVLLARLEQALALVGTESGRLVAPGTRVTGGIFSGD